jgi:phosphohistidine phosphatase
MKRLYLLRHAKSDWADPDRVDAERPLSPRGRRAAPTLGRYMRREGLIPALALTSAARRTEETWELLSETLKAEVPVETSHRLYLASPKRLLKAIRDVDDKVASVALVGHNPGLHALAIELTGSGDGAARTRMTTKYPTGGLAVFDFDVDHWDDVAAGGGRLERFVVPRDLD